MSDTRTLASVIGLDLLRNPPLEDGTERRKYRTARAKKIHHARLKSLLLKLKLPMLRSFALRPLTAQSVAEGFKERLKNHCEVWAGFLHSEQPEEHWHWVEGYIFQEPNTEWRKLGFRFVRAVQLARSGRWQRGYILKKGEWQQFFIAENPREALKKLLMLDNRTPVIERRAISRFLRTKPILTFADTKAAGQCDEGVRRWLKARHLEPRNDALPAELLIPYLDDLGCRYAIQAAMRRILL